MTNMRYGCLCRTFNASIELSIYLPVLGMVGAKMSGYMGILFLYCRHCNKWVENANDVLYSITAVSSNSFPIVQ